MRITDVKTVLLTGPSTRDPFMEGIRTVRSASLIEIHTDTEHTGIGETYAGYFCPELIPAVVEFFRPILIGQTVADVPELWSRMYRCGNFWCRVGLGATVLCGIEAALWDLKGKIENVPVYQLLGGLKHKKLPCYASGGPSQYPEQRLARQVEHYLSQGFRAVKLAAGRSTPDQPFYVLGSMSEAADCEAGKMHFLRSRFGNEISLMLDGHMSNSFSAMWGFETALAVARGLEPFNLLFLEEPLHYTDVTGYSRLCHETKVPIAGGECLTASCEWKVFNDQDCFDIGQPDASFIAGLGEFMTVSRMLEERRHKIATHSWGTGVSLMQNIHCAFAAANTCILEVPPDFSELHTELFGDSYAMRDGFVLAPQQPGLGIRVTDEIKQRYPFVPGSGEFNPVPGKTLLLAC